MKPFRVPVIDPGSTSTKVAVCDGESPDSSGTVRHQAAELEGCVDAVVSTGGLNYDERLVEWLRRRVAFIGPVLVYGGENEMEALRDAGLRVLAGEEATCDYQ